MKITIGVVALAVGVGACTPARVVMPLDGARIDSVTACVPVPVTAKVERCQ